MTNEFENFLTLLWAQLDFHGRNIITFSILLAKLFCI